MNILINILTFLLGLFLGHRLELRRDWRKEFNAVAKQFRISLQPLVDWLSRFPFPGEHAMDWLKEQEAAKAELEYHLPWWERSFFRKTWNRYRKELSEHTEDPNHQVSKYVKKLLAYAKPK